MMREERSIETKIQKEKRTKELLISNKELEIEKDLVKNGAIASLSFGAERKFSLRHKKTKEKISLLLEHGSLLLMTGVTQTYWQHCMPPTKRVIEPRVNLTFRSIAHKN